MRRTFPLVLPILAVLTMLSIASARAPVVEEGITYGRGGDVELKLDLARPGDGDGPFPAIVFIHGGGWRGGSRGDFRGLITAAADRGYVAVSISYRLTDAQTADGKVAHPWPAQIHDCKAAVRWLRANAARYRVDPERIGVAGGSAGGHLALMVGLAGPKDGLEGDGGHADRSSAVAAVVNIFGPTDLAAGYDRSPVGPPLLGRLLGGAPADVPERYREASPVTWVDADDPPVLTLHGDADEIVPVDQAHILEAVLKKAGVEHEKVIYPGQGHGFRGEAQRDALDRMFRFFAAHLGRRPVASGAGAGGAKKAKLY